MCNPAELDYWPVIAGRCGSTALAVWGAVSAMLVPDPVFNLLCPHDRKQTRLVQLVRLGLKRPAAALLLAALENGGVIADGYVTQAWRDVLVTGDAAVTFGDAPTVSPGDAAAARLARRRAVSRGTSARFRAKLRVASGDAAVTPSPDVTPASVCLFNDHHQVEKTNKQTRAREPSSGDAEGFAELVELWPEAYRQRLAEAETAYARYRQRHSRGEIIEAASRYLDAKPPGQYVMYPLYWLNSNPCRHPALPLPAQPRQVISNDRPARPDWRALADTWLSTGAWPPDIGPPPDDSGCEMPAGLHQATLQRKRRQTEREVAVG